MAKVWSKRFENSLDPFIEKFNASIGFDKKLILEDLDCSIAHAKMLGKTKVLSSSETLQIINGLEKIKVEYLEGKFSPSPPSEDIHYCIEEKLIETLTKLCKQSYTSQEILNKIFKKLDQFTGLNRHLADDASMVVLQIN